MAATALERAAAVFKDEIRVGRSVGRLCRFSRPRSLATTPKMRTAMNALPPPPPLAAVIRVPIGFQAALFCLKKGNNPNLAEWNPSTTRRLRRWRSLGGIARCPRFSCCSSWHWQAGVLQAEAARALAGSMDADLQCDYWD